MSPIVLWATFMSSIYSSLLSDCWTSMKFNLSSQKIYCKIICQFNLVLHSQTAFFIFVWWQRKRVWYNFVRISVLAFHYIRDFLTFRHRYGCIAMSHVIEVYRSSNHHQSTFTQIQWKASTEILAKLYQTLFCRHQTKVKKVAWLRETNFNQYGDKTMLQYIDILHCNTIPIWLKKVIMTLQYVTLFPKARHNSAYWNLQYKAL